MKLGGQFQRSYPQWTQKFAPSEGRSGSKIMESPKVAIREDKIDLHLILLLLLCIQRFEILMGCVRG